MFKYFHRDTTIESSWDSCDRFLCRRNYPAAVSFLYTRKAWTQWRDRPPPLPRQDSSPQTRWTDICGHCCRHGDARGCWNQQTSPEENQKDISSWIGTWVWTVLPGIWSPQVPPCSQTSSRGHLVLPPRPPTQGRSRKGENEPDQTFPSVDVSPIFGCQEWFWLSCCSRCVVLKTCCDMPRRPDSTSRVDI